MTEKVKYEIPNLMGRVQRKFERRTVMAHGYNDVWAIDLMDFTDRRKKEEKKEKNVKARPLYIFIVVDVFSRYAQAKKISNKEKYTIKESIEEMFENFGGKPRHIWSDKEAGVVGLNKWFEKLGIDLYHTTNSFKGPKTFSVSIAERFCRTFREAVDYYKQKRKTSYMIAINMVIDDFIPTYNKRKHTTLGISPEQAKNEINHEEVAHRQELREMEIKDAPNEMLEVGMKVYLQKPKQIIKSNRDKNYFEELFTISKIRKTNPPTYELKELGDEHAFYAQQLMKAQIKSNVKPKSTKPTWKDNV